MNDSRQDLPRTRTRTEDENLVMLDQQLALGAYLNALLKPAPPAEAEPAPATTETATAPAPEPPPAAVEVQAEAPVPAPVDVPPGVTEAAVPAAEETSARADNLNEAQPAAAACPDWAQGEFQCLLFKVAGLNLAVPLSRLNGVVPWDESAITEMPNHQPWFLGLREHHGERVKLVDIAAVVLPPERYAELGQANGERLGKVVMIDDNRWGLACEDVGEVVTLSRDDVKWRSERGRRPWLAGTVIEHMCALLDTEAFAEVLREEGLKHGR